MKILDFLQRKVAQGSGGVMKQAMGVEPPKPFERQKPKHVKSQKKPKGKMSGKIGGKAGKQH